MSPAASAPVGDNALYEIARTIEQHADNQLDHAIVANLRRTASSQIADPIFTNDNYVLALEMGAGWLVDYIVRRETA